MDNIKSISHALDLAQKEYEGWGSQNPKRLRLWQEMYIRHFIAQRLLNPKFDVLDFIVELTLEEKEDL
jgi:hypothetical protein